MRALFMLNNKRNNQIKKRKTRLRLQECGIQMKTQIE